MKKLLLAVLLSTSASASNFTYEYTVDDIQNQQCNKDNNIIFRRPVLIDKVLTAGESMKIKITNSPGLRNLGYTSSSHSTHPGILFSTANYSGVCKTEPCGLTEVTTKPSTGDTLYNKFGSHAFKELPITRWKKYAAYVYVYNSGEKPDGSPFPNKIVDITHTILGYGFSSNSCYHRKWSCNNIDEQGNIYANCVAYLDNQYSFDFKHNKNSWTITNLKEVAEKEKCDRVMDKSLDMYMGCIYSGNTDDIYTVDFGYKEGLTWQIKNIKKW